MLKFGSRGDSNIVYKCTVRLLEDTEILECEYKPHHKGKYLLEYVCQQLNLIEYDYLGLRFVDLHDQRHWLDLGKSIFKQVKDLDPVLFSFRVKFYPPDPFRLKDEITRYQIFLQLKRDLLLGRLYCVPNEAAMLAAFILQSELGDYDPEIHLGNYASNFKMLIKQTDPIEDKAMDIHQKQLKGQTQSQVENAFLKLACQLDTYGVDPHSVKDHKSSQLYLGINYSGILTIQGCKKTHHFRWADIQKINYEGKMFIVHLNYNDKKHTVGFKCPTGAACRHVWRCAIEQMLFFTLPTSSDAPTVTGGGFFSWGTKFKYTGRTEKEILEDSGSPNKDDSNNQCTGNIKRKASSVPATPSTPLQPHLGLETVSEDQEGMGMAKLRTTVLKDDSMDRFSDYYFRDSFEHSSSESQLNLNSYRSYEATNPSHRSSRSQTPLSHSQVDGRICLSNVASANVAQPKQPNPKCRKFNVVKAFVPSFAIVTVFLLISTIVLLETDSEFFTTIRNLPEINSLRYQVYEPLKQYLRQILSNIFS
ncbi:PREDICTED: FERM domain-containing protein 5 isoform X2 [Nicrophorus vespilloides]|uniref:Moesin/ezrin/radixin homolog 1 n=1 Tax=Nicrophorus vespilloides TaxID=110193 RepID=A0ABM1MQV1_NICVS|nr:PREDICTED: FERM domain-containing protein 5 isoform X2 [Nicrophorus vespilloides]